VKFYIDENLSPLIGEPVGRVYRKYQFRTPVHEGLRGVLDVPLFNDLAIRDFDAIITHDGRQLQEDHGERQALREAGLHWIGLPETKVSGAHGVSILAGTLLAAFPKILPELNGPPSAFHVAVDRVETGMVADAYPL
jgi:hypothetical protein